jgi:hypothetical protein
LHRNVGWLKLIGTCGQFDFTFLEQRYDFPGTGGLFIPIIGSLKGSG